MAVKCRPERTGKPGPKTVKVTSGGAGWGLQSKPHIALSAAKLRTFAARLRHGDLHRVTRTWAERESCRPIRQRLSYSWVPHRISGHPNTPRRQQKLSGAAGDLGLT